MEKDKNLGSLFSDIKREVMALVNLKLKIFRLDVYEKTSITSSVLLFGLILLLVVFFAVLFLFLALGMFLGECLGSNAAGMGLIALLYLLMFAVLLFQRKSIQAWLVDLFLTELTKNDDGDEREDS